MPIASILGTHIPPYPRGRNVPQPQVLLYCCVLCCCVSLAHVFTAVTLLVVYIRFQSIHCLYALHTPMAMVCWIFFFSSVPFLTSTFCLQVYRTCKYPLLATNIPCSTHYPIVLTATTSRTNCTLPDCDWITCAQIAHDCTALWLACVHLEYLLTSVKQRWIIHHAGTTQTMHHQTHNIALGQSTSDWLVGITHGHPPAQCA